MENFKRSVQEDPDGTVSVILEEEGWPDFRTTNPAVIRHDYLNGRLYEMYVYRKNPDGSIFFGVCFKSIRSCGRRVFPNKHWNEVVTMEDGKVTRRKSGLSGELAKFIVDELHLECLHCQTLSRYLSNKAVLTGVLKGEITNKKEMLRVYAKSAYRLPMRDYALFEKYMDSVSETFGVAALTEFTTDPWKAMRFCLEYRFGHSDNERYARWLVFKDLMKDASYLDDFRVNPAWSLNRMNEEHIKANRRVRELLRGSRSDKCVYDTVPAPIHSGSLRGHVISSDQDAFLESEEMDHCFSAHYFKKVAKYSYIGLSLTAPQRCTVGITVRSNEEGDIKLAIEQVQLSHNRSPEQSTREAVKEYVHGEGRDFLTALVKGRCTYSAVNENPVPMWDDDLPF